MGVRTKDRAANEPREPEPKPTVIEPREISVNDGNYRGRHPNKLAYAHVELYTDPAFPQFRVPVKAHSAKQLGGLKKLLSSFLFPMMEAKSIVITTLAEKRSGGQKEGTNRTLGACWADGAIILDMAQGPEELLYTAAHEAAHAQDFPAGHGPKFKDNFGRLLVWSFEDNEQGAMNRNALIALAKGDSYCPPKAPTGDWDDYARDGAPAKPAALTVDAGYGVADWGFDPQLLPERAASIEIDRVKLVGSFLDGHPEVLADTGNGGFLWDTGQLGATLSQLYAWELTERGVGQRVIPAIVRSMDFKAAIKRDLEAIEPVLDAEVRRRRDAGEVG